jgi:cell division protein FtsQ
MRRRGLLAASLISVLAFAAATDFGRHTRPAVPLIDQIDQMLVTSGWGINEIWLTGHHHAIDADLFDALQLAEPRSLLGFDPRKARERLENLPWVKTAVVARVFPDAVRVEVHERKPIARWTHHGRQALVDATGHLLAYVPKGAANELPVVRGSGAATEAASLLELLSHHPDIMQRLEVADRIGGRRWTLAFEGGARAHLPADDPGAALARLEDLVRRHAVLDSAAEIDLRLPNRTAIRGGTFTTDGAMRTASSPPRGS